MKNSRVNWFLLVNAALGSFLAGTASRIFAVSLPTIASSLETTIVGISWAVIAYQISQVSLSLVFGRIGDIYGRETMFGFGLVVSAIGALLCGFSQNITQLIFFRLFHGIGASMTQSQARALAMDSLPKESSGRAQGFMTTAFHSGVLVGPSVGGLIIDYIHWRAVFFFLVPIAAAGIVLAALNHKRGNMPQRPSANTAQREVDYLGAVLLVAATITLIAIIDYRIMETATGLLRVGLIAGFIVLFAGFLYRESSTPSPILDLSLFRIRMFTLSSLSLLMVGVAQVMIGFVLPFYLQDIMHLSPSFMGLLFISAPIFTVTLSPLVGWVTDKVGPRLPATVGLFFLVMGAFLGGFLRAESHWTFAVAVLAFWGLAMALFYPPNHTAMISSVPDQHRGVATGAIYVMFGLGTTLGVSLSTLLLTAAFRYYSGDATATPTPENAAVFVKSMNFSFLMSGIMGLVAMLCSAMRGQQATAGNLARAPVKFVPK
jgi:EmrB/QacA subfamily drug resistance transporter